MATLDKSVKISGAALEDAVRRAKSNAPFLARLIDLHPDILLKLQSDSVADVIDMALLEEDLPCANQLRRWRSRLFLALALGDLSGALPLEVVVETLSDFADAALDRAIASAIDMHVPGADPVGFVAIALGKHGSRELNYSSDIDPIFLYDPVTLPHRPREEPGEAAVRIARRVVDLMQARDGNGFVFRVDLRLRPASEATPIAIPIDAAISHYESSALAWERAAFIRARPAAGDTALGRSFLAAIRPFVWRRSLDFGAIGDLRALTRSIRDHHGHRALGPGFDVKRGRGGIREVEFYAQIHQLIHGGRDPALRIGATMPALSVLADSGWIDRAVSDDLAAAYRLLRTIEHRLQLIDDRQTHVIPEDADERDRAARLHGLADGDALIAMLLPRCALVEAHYDALDDAPEERETAFPGSYFADAAAADARIARWRAGGVRAIRSPAAVAAFEALLPDMLADIGRAPDPDAALARLDMLLGKLSSGINLFRLLDAQPALRVMLVDILSHAPTLAESLSMRPSLLDRLVDRTAFDAAPGLSALVAEMCAAEGSDIEAMLDTVRQVVGDYRFSLGTQIVEAARDPIDVAADYGRVAGAAVEAVAARVVAAFEQAHGKVGGGEFVILALGRLGGGLLTHASDLDLVYLFTGDFSSESDGARPLGASHYFNRLGQRITAALSVPTSAGALYEVDTRLRPSGAQGPLVVSFDSFGRYQREAAWTWEKMALTRARPVFGSQDARAALSGIIADVLKAKSSAPAVARDVAHMRSEIARHKPPTGAFDVKLGPGGLVDLEFTVHFHQLASGIGLNPDLRAAIGALAAAGLIEAELLDAHDLLTRLLVTLRLVTPDLGEPAEPSRALVARACQVADWPALLAELARARHCVTYHWRAVLALSGEQS